MKRVSGGDLMKRIPMIDAKRVNAVVRYLDQSGHAGHQMLLTIGLQPSRLSGSKARVPFSQYVELLERASTAIGDDLFGIRCASTFDPSQGGLFVYILLNSPTLHAAIQNAERYVYIHNEGASWFLIDEDVPPGEDIGDSPTAAYAMSEETGDLAAVQYVILDPAASGSVQQIGFALASFIEFVRQRTGRQLVPETIEVEHGPHAHPGEARRLLGAPIRYHATRNAILFRRDWLDLPVDGADVHLLEVLLEYADQVLAERKRELDLVDQLQAWVISRLSSGRFDAATAAREFGLSVRTLSRRLATHNTTYGQLVEEIRSRLAVRYVSDPSLQLTTIAYLLGYADPSSFSKAFKQQFGCSPQKYRRQSNKNAAA